MAEGSLNSGMEEGLIPGLPDDVSMQCLARISHGFEGVMQCVSKRWRDAFRGEEIGQIRAREGLSGDWIFVYTSDQFHGWQAYDPAADRWHSLPPAPGFGPCTKHVGFCCVVLSRRLLVFGGRRVLDLDDHSTELPNPIGHVLCFDPFFRKWTELPSMITPRVGFLCAIIDDRILVTGGGSASGERFDPETSTWKALPEIPRSLDSIRQVSMHSGQYQVPGNIGAIGLRDFFLGVNAWNVTPQALTMLNFLHSRETSERRPNEIFKKLLAAFNDHTKEWWTLLSEVSGHERNPDLSYYGLVKLKGRFYLFGRIKLEYDVNVGANVAVELSTVTYCNPSTGTPLCWHQVQPLLGRGGCIRACAILQQE